MDLEDHIFGSVLRQALPLLVAPPGSLPPAGLHLRGIVRSAPTKALVVFSRNSQVSPGIGCEFDLVSGQNQLRVDAAIDWLRVAIPDLDLPSGEVSSARNDSHGNYIVSAAAAGFAGNSDPVWYDQNLFGMLSIFVHGGGFPWFEEIFTCQGFMLLDSNTCRIYVRINADDDGIVGLDIPLNRADGAIIAGMGGNFPQELASVIGSNTLRNQPQVPTRDEYCAKVYDMARWIDPSAH